MTDDRDGQSGEEGDSVTGLGEPGDIVTIP